MDEQPGVKVVVAVPKEPVRRSCSVCFAGEAAWVHNLDASQVGYRVYGKGHTLTTTAFLCEQCEQLYGAGDDEGLVARHYRTWEQSEQDIDESIRKPIAVLRAAHRGVITVADWLPPGVSHLEQQGFHLIGELMGEECVGELWPEAHRRAVTETRPDWIDDDAEDTLVWMVRSPWPAIDVHEAVRLLWTYVHEREPARDALAWVVTKQDRAEHAARVHEFLRLSEHEALDYQRRHPT